MKFFEKRKNWDDELTSILLAYRTTPSNDTNDTPFSCAYECEAIAPMVIYNPNARTQENLPLPLQKILD